MSKRNKAKKPQWKPEPTDINILILGSAGVGKSREIAVVGHGLESCTKDLQPIPFSKPDDPTCRIVLVDTPGFLDTYEEDIFQTERWLRMLLENDARIAGVIYLHDISQGRSMATDCVWETTQDICGQDAFQNMVIVTTKWELSPGLAECRCEEELSDIVWKRAREKGARVVRFDGTQVSARQIISLATQEPLIKPLQLERDLRRRRGGNLGHSFDKPLRSPPSDSGSTLNQTTTTRCGEWTAKL
ncbi:hypothetical protein BJ138DRAFT_895530 [Hygrophoropsis aurantiaca]|uniref:Uncharacterized protein n=1 Tax=Hygrophoropsis aurantiaca TaxID=72124 RepID=A0ACB8AEC7_9AGAM|nr:hypothetical protein BJ138DRAFT_895530 [Hygrophoropsis aurantiaca]